MSTVTEPMTIAEWERAYADTEERWELVRGVPIMSPRGRRPAHVTLIVALVGMLRQYEFTGPRGCGGGPRRRVVPNIDISSQRERARHNQRHGERLAGSRTEGSCLMSTPGRGPRRKNSTDHPGAPADAKTPDGSETPARLTLDEFESTPTREGERWELVLGFPRQRPSGSLVHTQFVNRVMQVLRQHLHPDEFFIVPGAGLALPSRTGRCDSLFIPDLAVGKERPGPGKHLKRGDVLLVVEVVSPTSLRHDYLVKRHEYAAASIPSYLVVGPQNPPTPLTLYTQPLSGDYMHAHTAAATMVRIDGLDIDVQAKALGF